LKDIILYRTGRGIIGHRVLRIANLNGASVLLVRGDAEQGSGEPVGADQILGTLVAVGRDGRCIDLASRKTKVKQAISIIALQTADTPLTYRLARKLAFRLWSDRSKRGWLASTSTVVAVEWEGTASIFTQGEPR
jgi:hypothetical protein